MSTDKNLSIDRVVKDASEKNIPIAATIELVTICNWKCNYCYIPEHNSAGLPHEMVIRLIDELRETGVYQLILTGGEMFLRADALEIIAYARKLHMRVNILSNATLITDDIARRLSELHITDYSLTIFSLDENIHDSITGVKGSLKAALNGVGLLEKYKIPIEIKTPLLSENYNEFLLVKEFCDKKGFSFSSSPCVSPKTDGNMDPLKYSITEEQLDEIIVEIDEIANFKAREAMPEYMCDTIRHSLFISSDGNVYPCNGLYGEMGNIKECSISKIWNSHFYMKLRNLKNIESKSCIECDLVSFCDRCVGMVFSETNELFGCSAICKNIAVARNNNYIKEVSFNE